MTCPNCRGEMTAITVEAHYGKTLVIDLCEACQAFWFDGLESLQLQAASVLELFRRVGESVKQAHSPFSDHARCPRCDQQLVRTFDLQRQSRFEYRRCPAGHGRLTSFFNFLREKNFIKPLSAPQLAELRKNLRAVNCSNCGGPIDLASSETCSHCGSPLSILDVAQAEALVAALKQKAEKTGSVDPALPLNLERARREAASAFGEFERDPAWYGDASSAGLVNAALGAFSRWLAKP